MSYLTAEETRTLAQTSYNKDIDKLIRKAALKGESQINVTNLQVSERDIEALRMLGYNVKITPGITEDSISFISIDWRIK